MHTQELQYRTATINDLPALLELSFFSYCEFSQQVAPEESIKFKTNLRNEERMVELMQMATTFLAQQDGKVVGMAYFVPRGNPTNIYEKEWCYIRKLGVDPACRGQGIARHLTQLCINQAKALGEKAIWLHTSEMMPGARHLYEQLGFELVRDLEPIFGKRYWLFRLELE